MTPDEELLRYYLAHQPPAPRRIGFVGWCVRVVEWALLFILTAFVVLYILPLVGQALTEPDAPAVQPPAAPVAAPPPAAAPVYTTSGGPSSLPPCSSVNDTVTACRQDAPAAVVEERATEVPAPTTTPTPAYEAACWTAPGARPCWLPADAAWEPLASVPATPLVLLPEPPSVDVCAMWRPPLAYPEGCEE